MKKILTMVFAAMAVMTMWGQTNLALNQPSIATSGTASAGNDGNTGTRWESASADPQQWQVDLGEAQDFNTITIRWEGAYAKTFDIVGGNVVGTDGFITDGVVLTSIEGQSLSGFPYVQRLTLPQTAHYRYVQFLGTERGTVYGYSFWEFGVYNIAGDPVLTTMNLTASGSQVEIGQNLNLTLAAFDELGAAYTVDNVQYVLSNPSVGTVVNGVFTGSAVGETTIKAVSGNVESNAVTVKVVGGQKIDLFTDWQYRIYNLGLATSGSKVGAFDNNDGSNWDMLGKTTGADEASRTYDVGFIADLRGIYDLSSIAIHFEGACSEEFTLAFAGEDGVFGEDVVTGGTGVYGVNNHTETFDCSAFTGVRYVKFFSTKAATEWSVKIFDFAVIGTLVNAVSDNVAPVIASAEADAQAATETSVTLNINASDNSSKFLAYLINNTVYTPGEGHNIVIEGLEAGTEYSFSVVAIDAFNNRSEAATVTAQTTGQGVVGQKIDLFTDWQFRVYNLGLATSGSKVGAFDDNDGSNWDMLGKTTGADEASRTYDVGFIADLRGVYDLSRIAIHFEGACSEAFTLAFAGEDGVFGETVVSGGTGVYGVNNHTETFDCSAFTGVRYVKFFSTKAATEWSVKIFDFTVIGVLVNAVTDTEAPVIASAEADAQAATETSVTLNLNATDNSSQYVAYSINNEIYALGTNVAGTSAPIVINDLNGGTSYDFTVIAIDAFNNRSEAVTVTAQTTGDVFELTSAPAPTQAAENVVSIYSDTYTPATTFWIGNWSQATQAVEETIDDNKMYLFTNYNYLGFEYNTDVDLAGMEYLHVDVLPMQPMSLGVTPIMRAGAGATEQSTSVGTLTPRQWNSIDLPLTAFTNIDFNAGVASFQFKFDGGTASEKLYVDNLYFWKSAAQPSVLGDLNGDGKVDVSDVNIVINMMLGKNATTPEADMNGDNKVDVSDVNAIINLMLGKGLVTD